MMRTFTWFAAAFVDVRATLLGDVPGFALCIATWILTRLPWARTPATHGDSELPAPEQHSTVTVKFA